MSSPVRLRRLVARASCLTALLLLSVELLFGQVVQRPTPQRPRQAVTVNPGPTLEDVELASDARRAGPGSSVVTQAAASSLVSFRALAARVIGRQENTFFLDAQPWAGIDDADPSVRREAWNAMGQGYMGVAVEGPIPVMGKVHYPHEESLARDYALLLSHFAKESDETVQGVMYETLGRLSWHDNALPGIEEKLRSAMFGSLDRKVGALLGLDAMLHWHPTYQIAEETRVPVRTLAAMSGGSSADAMTGNVPDTPTRIKRLAISLLQSTGDSDVPTIDVAAADPDWQVRRIAAQMLNLALPENLPVLDQLLQDQVFQVRLEALRVADRSYTVIKTCAPFVKALDDLEPAVVMQAMGSLQPDCPEPPPPPEPPASPVPTQHEQVIARLITEAKRLQTSQSNTEWQVPMAALAALARLSVKDAAEINATLAHHDVWQVRDAVAHVANQLGDINRVIAFVHDPHPNVRTTALRLLADDQVAGLARLAIEALTSDDYQLVRTAVAVLARTNASTDAIPPLMDALSRITRDNKDTSRDVRVDIINRLSQMPAFDTTLFFVPFEKGFDMAVRDAAISAIATILKRSDFPMGTPPEAVLPTGTPPEAILAPPQIRLQPSATDLQPLPTTATIEMADRSGTIQLQFLSDQTEAPVTIWRFAEAAKRGYYNNRPFYRVVTDVMVQGGSPGDNEDMSDVFFMRDEVGLERHTRGAVGISVEDAPGHDTGALQFFIDLVDAPQIDHRRTVFARVASGMDVVDRLLEGATIKTVTVK